MPARHKQTSVCDYWASWSEGKTTTIIVMTISIHSDCHTVKRHPQDGFLSSSKFNVYVCACHDHKSASSDQLFESDTHSSTFTGEPLTTNYFIAIADSTAFS